MRRLLVGVILLSLSGCGIPFLRDQQKEAIVATYPPEIIPQTEELVTNILISPGSAKFSRERVLVNKEKHQTIVEGVVDSQNSFGGLMRSKFEDVYVEKPDGRTERRGVLTDNQGNIHLF